MNRPCTFDVVLDIHEQALELDKVRAVIWAMNQQVSLTGDAELLVSVVDEMICSTIPKLNAIGDTLLGIHKAQKLVH